MKSFAFSVLGFCLAVSDTFAQPPAPGALTAEQVSCEEEQLAHLERRIIQLDYPTSNLFLWRSGAGGGDYSGLGVVQELGGGAGRFERQLSFELLLSNGLDRLDPARPLLPQATLVRRDAASNLIASPLPPELPIDGVNLALAPGVVDPFPFQARQELGIFNLRGPTSSRAERSGWGIVTDNLARPCHGEVSELDERVFLILARSLRVVAVSDLTGSIGLKVTLFRGLEPLHYRANIYSYSAECDGDAEICPYGEAGPTALELIFELNSEGQFTSGRALVLPECTGPLVFEPPGCTSQVVHVLKIYFLPPLIAGIETQSQAVVDTAPFLFWPTSGNQPAVTEVTIDWGALLASTAWNGVR